jgi:hypothetical protein
MLNIQSLLQKKKDVEHPKLCWGAESSFLREVRALWFMLFLMDLDEFFSSQPLYFFVWEKNLECIFRI